MDYTQQNSSQEFTRANEHKARHNWVRKVIHWELCNKLKFDRITKWYMHNSEFVPGKMRRIKFSDISWYKQIT